MKGVSLSLNTVIVGVLLLIVLAVVIFIFFRGTTTFDEGSRACDDCVMSRDQCMSPGPTGKNVVAVPMKCSRMDNSVGNYCCTELG